MSLIKANCGHLVEYDMEMRVARKGYTREWYPCINFMTVCPACYKVYKKDGTLLTTDGEEDQWLEYL